MEVNDSTVLEVFLHKHPDTKYVNLFWVDFYGILRVRTFTVWRAREMCTQRLPLKVSPVSMANLATEDINPSVGVNMMHPDWTSLHMIEPRHAALFCFVESKSGSADSDVHMAQKCPRSALLQVLRYCKELVDQEPIAGFELEFYLLDHLLDSTALRAEHPDPRSYWSTASSIRETDGLCIEACVAALEDSHIMVQQFHSEGDNAQQYEIVLAPGPLLESIDNMVIAQEIIKRTARRAGKWATFMPKPFATRAPSGLHAHISFENLIEDQRKAFLAGILHRLPLLCAFSMPYDQSYKRIGFPMLSEWVSWGWENRDVAVREIETNHWELRHLDFTANPYLALAVYLLAGVLGIAEKQGLRLQSCQYPVASLSEAGRTSMGLDTKVPTTLDASLRILEQGFMGLDSILGKPILQFYCEVKRDQQKKFETMGELAVFDFLAKEF